LKRLLAWLVALSLAAAAQEPYVFHTSPEGADIYFHNAPAPGVHNAATAPAEPSFVGRSGQPLQLDLSPFVPDNGRLELTVSFRLAGHKEVVERPGNDFLKDRRWPRTGSLRLPPTSTAVAVQDFLRAYGLLLGVVVGVSLGGVVVFARQRRALRVAREREARRERLIRPEAGDPLIGQRLGKYLVVNKLGQGGMAVVYRAVSETTLSESQAVAVKVISPAVQDDPEFTQRFRREVRTYLELSHPNIVRLIDWSDDPMFLAMELIDGPTLRQRMQQPVSVDEAVSMMYSLIGALAYAHQQGIVHRDLKPENVMLARGEMVKVMDFGLARPHQVSRRITATGTALGTPDYMAPEQLNGDTAPSADQYALGIIFYELLAQRLPFEGDLMAVLLQRMSDEAPILRAFRPELPEELCALVQRMIRRDAEERFEQLADVLTELERLYPRLAAWRTGRAAG